MKKFIIISLILYFIGFINFAYKINAYDVDKLSRTDAIVVLTGGKNRIKKGIDLINGGIAEKMFISGVDKKINAKDLNINDKYIELGYDAKTTYENAIEVRSWVDKNNIKSIRLVTSNYHMPRAMLELKNKNSKLIIIENPIYSENIALNWWQNFGTAFFIFVEYNKFLCVFMRTLI